VGCGKRRVARENFGGHVAKPEAKRGVEGVGCRGRRFWVRYEPHRNVCDVRKPLAEGKWGTIGDGGGLRATAAVAVVEDC
jgi:hypothetical protein